MAESDFEAPAFVSAAGALGPAPAPASGREADALEAAEAAPADAAALSAAAFRATSDDGRSMIGALRRDFCDAEASS
jgi:hypothetical protein